LREGHAVTLYDAHQQAGGMLRYGIPAYRLPKGPLDREIQVVRDLGAEIRMGESWGRDFHLEGLLERHDAVFVAIGDQRSMELRCEGDELALDAVDLLAAVARDETPELGRRVVVVGGGNTAMDAARSARRLGSEVKVVYRRTEREMPCLAEEVEGAREEGVEIDFLVAPVRVERPANGETVLVCQHMELGEPDESGRRRPEPILNSYTSYPCDNVVAAVGQSVATELAAGEGLETTSWGIKADSRTLETNVPRVFSGGDAVLGADLAVRAVAAGRLAATSIGQLLSGEPVLGLREQVNVFFQPIDDEELAEVFRDIERQPQIPTPELPPAERLTSFAEIDAGLSAESALSESRRCMSCGCTAAVGCSVRQYATEYEADPTRYLGVRRRLERDDSHPEVVYEPGKCILCDACVRIAKEAAEPLGVALIGRGFQVAMGVPFEQPLSDGLRDVAERCAEACPTGALTLRRMRSCDLGGCGGGGRVAPGERLVTLGKGL
ncbi:MAG: FAD-dependent oxidoreductase, partial [bacterium]|nr:FAD-dependent oxidoreductase [bacterium]